MKVIRCDESCKHKGDRGYCFGCRQLDKWEENKQSIEFKRINGLTPTVESCTMKLLEEVGELMQLIGKGQGLSGEKHSVRDYELADEMLAEALDVAQSAVTMAFVINDKFPMMCIDSFVKHHEQKLKERGYLK